MWWSLIKLDLEKTRSLEIRNTTILASTISIATNIWQMTIG